MAPKPHSILADCFLFTGGATSAVLLFWAFYSFLSSNPSSLFSFPTFLSNPQNPTPQEATFYDDPTLAYTIDSPLHDWDRKRRQWLDHHPSFGPNSNPYRRILLLSGSQPGPCENPIGDHLLLRFFKNKSDYCRIHGCEFFYNTALFHPKMFEYWNKIPTIRSAMVAHPEAEWIWWVDSDAAFTDMDFELPLHKYKNHNLVVHGWPDMVYNNKSWTSLNAGVFLIRNCQWSLDLMEAWASMGPQTPQYKQWGKTLKAEIKDKLYPESDDQSGLVYLLLKEKHKWGDKVYLENEFYFEGYWVEILGGLANVTEEKEGKRRAEVERRKAEMGRRRRPFVTHFTGCQPCSGRHNEIYSGKECLDGMRRALDFADDQVLRSYGFKHAGSGRTGEVRPLPFRLPAN